MTALRILDKVYMALGVTAHEINGKSQGFAVCEARQMAALAMHEAGMSWTDIGVVLGGRAPDNIRKIANTAKRRCRGTTAMAYIDARMPVSERAFVKALSKPSNEHTHRILDDMKRGMSALETLRYWPYMTPVTLDTVEAVRRSVA